MEWAGSVTSGARNGSSGGRPRASVALTCPVIAWSSSRPASTSRARRARICKAARTPSDLSVRPGGNGRTWRATYRIAAGAELGVPVADAPRQRVGKHAKTRRRALVHAARGTCTRRGVCCYARHGHGGAGSVHRDRQHLGAIQNGRMVRGNI